FPLLEILVKPRFYHINMLFRPNSIPVLPQQAASHAAKEEGRPDPVSEREVSNWKSDMSPTSMRDQNPQNDFVAGSGARQISDDDAGSESEPGRYKLGCVRDWIHANSGIIVAIPWLPSLPSKAMRPTLSHNFSIIPMPTDEPTPGRFIEDYSRSVTPTLISGCMGIEVNGWRSPDKTDLLVGPDASHGCKRKPDPILATRAQATTASSGLRLPLRGQIQHHCISLNLRIPARVQSSDADPSQSLEQATTTSLSTHRSNSSPTILGAAQSRFLAFLSPSITSNALRFYTTSDPSSPPSLIVSTGRFAHPSRPLRLRTWPWPISRRDHIWKVLAEEEAGLQNADDIESATSLEWNRASSLGVSSVYIFVVAWVMTYLHHRSGKNSMRSSIAMMGSEDRA
ncbi:hypothetical protein E4U43_008606, partial [Claviceps pusilla]